MYSYLYANMRVRLIHTNEHLCCYVLGLFEIYQISIGQNKARKTLFMSKNLIFLSTVEGSGAYYNNNLNCDGERICVP